MCILTNSAIRVIGASFFLLVLLSGIPARAQVNCPSAGTQGGVGFSNDAFDQRYSTCAQVTVPKARQFIILQVNEFTMRWQGTNGCSGDWVMQMDGSCTPPMTMTVSVNGLGLNYTSDQITAPFSSPPSDFGRVGTTLVPSGQCLARYTTLTAPTASSAILAQPFLTVETSGLATQPQRGHIVGDGLDIMGIAPVFNRAQFGTTYSFDPLCELPYLNPTPSPQRSN